MPTQAVERELNAFDVFRLKKGNLVKVQMYVAGRHRDIRYFWITGILESGYECREIKPSGAIEPCQLGPGLVASGEVKIENADEDAVRFFAELIGEVKTAADALGEVGESVSHTAACLKDLLPGG